MPDIEQYSSGGGKNFHADRDINYNITANIDIRQLFAELAALNLPKLAEAAEAEKQRRTTVFSEKFLRALKRRGPIGSAKLADPGVQAAMADAVSAYVRSNNDDSVDVLADLVAERALGERADIVQFCLDHAIPIVPRLDAEHLKALSLLLFVARTSYEYWHGYETLYASASSCWIPFGESLDISETDVRYLEASGCTTWHVHERSIPEVLREAYPGLFTHGFTLDRDSVLKDLISKTVVLPDSSEEIPVLVPCYRDASLFQVNAVTPAELETLLSGVTDPAQRNFLKYANKNLTVSDEQIEADLIECDSRLEAVMRNWNATTLKRQVISATGITIAHANARRVLGEEFAASLELWLPPR